MAEKLSLTAFPRPELEVILAETLCDRANSTKSIKMDWDPIAIGSEPVSTGFLSLARNS